MPEGILCLPRTPSSKTFTKWVLATLVGNR